MEAHFLSNFEYITNHVKQYYFHYDNSEFKYRRLRMRKREKRSRGSESAGRAGAVLACITQIKRLCISFIRFLGYPIILVVLKNPRQNPVERPYGPDKAFFWEVFKYYNHTTK